MESLWPSKFSNLKGPCTYHPPSTRGEVDFISSPRSGSHKPAQGKAPAALAAKAPPWVTSRDATKKPCKGETKRVPRLEIVGFGNASIPNISFVKLDSMSFEQHAQLILKRHLPVMRFLIFNVSA